MKLLQRNTIPVTWTFQPRHTLIFGKPMDLKHPILPGQYLSSCYPLTVLDRSSNGKVDYKAFTICFFRLSSPFELAIVMDHTTFFKDNFDEKRAALEKLIEYCEGLARKVGAQVLETEVYVEAKTEIAFPSTLSFYDSYNDPWLPKALLKIGFKKVEEKLCFTSNIDDLTDHWSSGKKAIVRPWRGESLMHLWTNGLHIMEDCHNLIEERIMSMMRFNSLVFWQHCISDKEGSEFVLLAKSGLLRKKLVGIALWLPNIYSIAWTEGTRLYYMPKDILREKLPQELTGKLFKIILDYNYLDVWRDLIIETLHRMKTFGVKNCQVGNIPKSSSNLLSFLSEMGFRVTHSIWKLRRKLR